MASGTRPLQPLCCVLWEALFSLWPQTQRQPPGVQRGTEESCTPAKPFGEEAPRVFSYRSPSPRCSSSNLSFPLVFSRRCKVGWLEWLNLPGTSALNDLPKGGALGTLSPPRGCSTSTLQAPYRRQPARALVVLLEKNRRASCFEEVETLLLMIGLSLRGDYNHLDRLSFRVAETPANGAHEIPGGCCVTLEMGIVRTVLRVWKEGTRIRMQMQSQGAGDEREARSTTGHQLLS